MRTKKISNEIYDGLPFSLTEIIQEHVERESRKWWGQSEATPLPRCEKPEKVKWSAGLVNLMRQTLSLAEQLRP